MKQINLLIVTGMSGAGKSVVLNSLEDVGYHCIDNFPPKLLPKLTELIMGTSEHSVNLAVVIDLRSLDFESIDEMLYFLQDSHYVNVNVLYLDASNETLVKRYKETRRTHPLSRDTNLLDGIEKERELLKPIGEISNLKIDTSNLAAKDLKQQIISNYSTQDSDYFTVTFMSFGFKHGTPIDTDIMFDVRFLPNPFYIEDLRPQTGLDDGVYEYVMGFEETNTFLVKLVDLLEFLIPKYKAEGKSQIVIGIGCTGGQHRSVAISQYLATSFEKTYKTNSSHRDIHRAHKK
ncbi:MAG TPA: RNase adapter RapZ [Firmicutes bacterium]|nr:RNase adapter RapZ [Bacillota bacterium]